MPDPTTRPRRPRPAAAARVARAALVALGAAAGAVAVPALLFAQPAARAVVPVLRFPEPGLDDPAAYDGYETRLFRDAAGNTVQVYLDGRQGRMVHVLANAENESVGFSARTADGRPAPLAWADAGARVGRAGRRRTLEYAVTARAPEVAIGQFLLGSMRVERDFQYERSQGRGNAAMAGAAYPVAEVERLLAAVAALPAAERARHLALLGAPDVEALRARTRPTTTVAAGTGGGVWRAVVTQPTLDGRDTLALEISADPARVEARVAGDSLVLRARGGGTLVPFTVRVATTARALTPMTRAEIFRPAFLRFLAAAGRDTSAAGRARARLMERQALGVELLTSREKLMAGLPTYATYFGRDLMVSALMMRDVWRPEVLEAVVGSVLRNLAPDGQVSHEEALGGQAVREGAAEYAALLARSDTARARAVLGTLRATRQNYHMVDDEFQLPVLAARWMADPAVGAARKRAFLLGDAGGASAGGAPAGGAPAGGEPRVVRLVRTLALVARLAAPYAARPDARALVAFPRAGRDSTLYESASWRDSGAGYGNGRFAMDVNAIWVPHALEATGVLLDQLAALGYTPERLAALAPDLGAALAPAAPLGRYARDRAALRRDVATWRGAERHFVVRLPAADVRGRVAARLAALPEAERRVWARAADSARALDDSLAFLAVALDSAGAPVAVANTDPATRLFLGEVGRAPGAGAAAGDAAADSALVRDVRLFTRAYPAGLLVGRVGPAVSNDAYAAPALWRAFEADPYHGPRVVWGREVNLFLLGVADRIAGAGGGRDGYVRELRSAFDAVGRAAEAAGFKSELWRYEVADGRVRAVRYGSGNDVQLWTTTELAVRYAEARVRGGR